MITPSESEKGSTDMKLPKGLAKSGEHTSPQIEVQQGLTATMSTHGNKIRMAKGFQQSRHWGPFLRAP